MVTAVGLLDIAPATDTVQLRGQPVAVYGVSAKGLAYLMSRFPELRMLMTGKEVDEASLMNVGGECVAAIIAAGCGLPGNTDAEASAATLPLEDQADVLAKILKLTMPNGAVPFAEKLAGLTSFLGVEGAQLNTAQATKSRKQ